MDVMKLPRPVQILPKPLRVLWAEVYSASHDGKLSDGQAQKAAWSAVRSAKTARRARKMVEKALSLEDWRSAVRKAFRLEFKVSNLWPSTVEDDHLIVEQGNESWDMAEGAAQPEGAPALLPMTLWRVPYTMTRKTVEGSDTEIVESVTFAARDQWRQVVPIFATLKTMKDGDRTRWVTFSSGGFEDRDHEIVSTDFLLSAVENAKRVGSLGPLLQSHIVGAQIGECDTSVVIGEPGFLVESGLFDDTEDGRKAAAYYDQHGPETGCSIRFLYAKKSAEGVYQRPGLILERSLLPRKRAAFPWSGFDVQGVEKMAKNTVSKDARSELAAVVGEDRADQIIESVLETSKGLQDLGIRYKEIAAKAEDAPDTEDNIDESPANDTETEEMAAKEASPVGDLVAAELGEFEIDMSPETIAEITKSVTSTVSVEVAALGVAVKQVMEGFAAEIAKMSEQINALAEADEAKIAEKAQSTSRATMRRVLRPTDRRLEAEAEKGTGEHSALDLIAAGMSTLHGRG